MIEIYETHMMGRRTLIATAETFAEAKDKVIAMGVSFMEDDEDFIDSADAFMLDGRTVAIQPEGLDARDPKWRKLKTFAKERADAARAFDDEFGIVHKGAPY
jgi:hypothetical protein